MKTKRDIQRKKDYGRTILSIFAVLFVMILLFAAVFYGQCEQILLERTHAYVSGALEQASELAANMHLEVVKLCMQMYSGNLIDLLSFSADPNHFFVLDALQKMENYRFISTYIESIYVYSRVQNRMYLSADHISNKVQTKEDFYDQDVFRLFSKDSGIRPLVAIPRKVPVELTGEKYDGFSYLFYDCANIGECNTIMVVNVRTDILSNAWRTIGKGTQVAIIALDSQGNVMADADTWGLKKQFTEGSIQSLIGSKTIPSNSFALVSLEGKKIYATSTRPDERDWRYIGIVSESTLSGEMNQFLKKTLFFALVILLAGIILACITAVRLARPMIRLREKMVSLEDGQAEDKKQLRTNLLRKMLLSCELQSDEELKRLGLIYSDSTVYRVLLFSGISLEKDAKGKVSSKPDAMLEQAFSAFSGSFAVEMSTNDIAMVLMHDIHKQDVSANVKEIIDLILQQTKAHFSATLSTSAATLEDISFLYNQACQYMVYRLFRGANSLICVEDEIALKHEAAPYPVKLEQQMCDDIANARFDNVGEYCKALLKTLENLPPMQLDMASTHMMFSIGNAIETFRKNHLPDLPLNYNLDRLFARSDSIDDIHQRLLIVFNELVLLYQQNRSDRVESFAAQLNTVLEAQYCNSNLSLNMIADMIGLTPNYIGRMYKRATGVSVPDRIMHLRMNKAKSLLKDTHRPIAQIAEEVGFTGEGYFYKAFKQNNGCTPSDYRKKLKESKYDK